MKRCRSILFPLVLAVIPFISACSKATNDQGPWLGMNLPGDAPELFAPGIVSTGAAERDIAVTADGRELFFSRTVVPGSTAIMTCRLSNGKWNEPEVAEFSRQEGVQDTEPFVSPDGKRLYFVSERANAKTNQPAGNWDIWYVERLDTGWGPPQNLGPPVNTQAGEFFPAVTADGTLFFCRADPKTRRHFIFRAAPEGNGFATPQKLVGPPNASPSQFNTYVAPDESLMILSVVGRKDSLGGCDYYLSFRDESDQWSELLPLPPGINSDSRREWSPFLSPDGSVLFFMSSRGRAETYRAGQMISHDDLAAYADAPENGYSDIYWVRADFIPTLRGQAIFKRPDESAEEVSP